MFKPSDRAGVSVNVMRSLRARIGEEGRLDTLNTGYEKGQITIVR